MFKLFVILLLPFVLHAQIIPLVFNTLYEVPCSTPNTCDFTDPAIWLPPITPNRSCAVLVASTLPVRLVVGATSGVAIYSLTLQGLAGVIVNGQLNITQEPQIVPIIALSMSDNTSIVISGSMFVWSIAMYGFSDFEIQGGYVYSRQGLSGTYPTSIDLLVVVHDGTFQTQSVYVNGVLRLSGSGRLLGLPTTPYNPVSASTYYLYIGDMVNASAIITVYRQGFVVNPDGWSVRLLYILGYMSFDSCPPSQGLIVQGNGVAVVNSVGYCQMAIIQVSGNGRLYFNEGTQWYLTGVTCSGNNAIIVWNQTGTFTDVTIGMGRGNFETHGIYNFTLGAPNPPEALIFGGNPYGFTLATLNVVSEYVTLIARNMILNSPTILTAVSIAVIPAYGQLSLGAGTWSTSNPYIIWNEYGIVNIANTAVLTGGDLVLVGGRQIYFQGSTAGATDLSVTSLTVNGASIKSDQYGGIGGPTTIQSGLIYLALPGIFTPNGYLTVQGNLTLTTDSNVTIARNINSYYGNSLHVNGAVALAGQLHVLISGGRPNPFITTYEVAIITSTGLSGDFDGFSYTLASSLTGTYTVTYRLDATNVYLDIAP